jgi:Fe-S-cluster containining protein
MAAHLRHVVRLLQDTANRSPCSAAAGYLTALYDRTVAPHPDIACRKGCSYCCSQDVAVTAPEAFLVAATIRNNPAAVAAVLEAEQRLTGLTPEARLGQVLCPLLSEAACSIYAARPLGCHGFVSVNLQACIDTFVEHKPPQVPMPQNNVSTLFAVRMMMKAALRLIGREDQTFEMIPAVAAILRQPDAERRWLAGEAIFAQVQGEAAIPHNFEIGIQQMAAHVRPTI